MKKTLVLLILFSAKTQATPHWWQLPLSDYIPSFDHINGKQVQRYTKADWWKFISDDNGHTFSVPKITALSVIGLTTRLLNKPFKTKPVTPNDVSKFFTQPLAYIDDVVIGHHGNGNPYGLLGRAWSLRPHISNTLQKIKHSKEDTERWLHWLKNL